MTKPEWKELGRYIRWCADGLGLRDWTLELLHEPASSPKDDDHSETIACVHVTSGRKFAVVKVAANFRMRPPKEQRHAIIHELLHCHLDGPWRSIGDELYQSERLTATEYGMVKSSFSRASEIVCDDIAAAVAHHYPLIAWPPVRKQPRKGRK
jgi:hypothetical protein